MTIREAFERVAKGNFNNGYGFDLQMLVDCMGILSKAINNWEIIPTQAVENAIAEIQAEIDNSDDPKFCGACRYCLDVICKHTKVGDEDVT